MSFLSSIKRSVASRFPRLYDAVQTLRAISNTSSRATLKADKEALHHLKQQLGNRFTKTARDRQNKTVLFFSLGNIRACLLEASVIAAFQKAGYEPVILSSRNARLRQAYELLGLTKFSTLDNFQRTLAPGRLEQAIKDVTSLKGLITVCDGAVRVGKYAASSLLRTTRRGSIDLSDPTDQAICRNALTASLAAGDAAKRIIEKHNPSAVVMTDRGYTPYGEVFDVTVARGIPLITFNAAYRPGEIVLKQFFTDNVDRHFLTLSDQTWSRLRALPWPDSKWRGLEQDFDESYTNGNWFAEVGTQVDVETQNRTALIHKLKLDPKKKTAIIFAHIFWDATFFYGTDLFQNYEEWLCETLRIAAANDRVNWIVKVHPANVVKDHRDGATGEHGEMAAIRRTLGELPDHIKVLPADTSIGTLSLFSLMDFCLTVRGTIGIEAACRGIRVLTAGTGRYDGYGFTADFDARDDYLRVVEKIEDLAPMNTTETELARRYAYGVFKARSIPLRSVGFSFKRDAKAEMETWINVENRQQLMMGEDVISIANWIVSGDEDCCHWQSDEGI